MAVIIRSGLEVPNKAFVLWRSLANASRVSASSEAAGYPAINATDPANWSSWRPSAGIARITFDMRTYGSIDTIGISTHNLATQGVTYRIQYSDDNATWINADADQSPVTNEDIIHLIPSLNANYISIFFNGVVGYGVGVIFMGRRLEFPSTPVDSYTPLQHARRYNKYFNDSLGGYMLGNRVMSAGAETEVNFPVVSRDFVDGPLSGFEDHYNQGGTFFYAGYPTGKPQDMGYCRAPTESDTVAVEYVHADKLASLSFGIHSYVTT